MKPISGLPADRAPDLLDTRRRVLWCRSCGERWELLTLKGATREARVAELRAQHEIRCLRSPCDVAEDTFAASHRIDGAVARGCRALGRELAFEAALQFSFVVPSDPNVEWTRLTSVERRTCRALAVRLLAAAATDPIPASLRELVLGTLPTISMQRKGGPIPYWWECLESAFLLRIHEVGSELRPNAAERIAAHVGDNAHDAPAAFRRPRKESLLAAQVSLQRETIVVDRPVRGGRRPGISAWAAGALFAGALGLWMAPSRARATGGRKPMLPRA